MPPIYDFHCAFCNTDFESLIWPNDPAQCPKCRTFEVNQKPSVIGGYSEIKGNTASARPKGAGSRPKSHGTRGES